MGTRKAGFRKNFHELIFLVTLGDRAFLAVGGQPESFAGGKIFVFPTFQLPNIADVQVKPYTLRIVNHNGYLTLWFENPMKLIENTIKIQAVMKNSRSVYVINRTIFQGQFVFDLIELNEFNGCFVQFKSFSCDLQGLRRNIHSVKLGRLGENGESDQVIPWPASIVDHHVFVLPTNRQKIDIAGILGVSPMEMLSESSVEPNDRVATMLAFQ